jgi:uracil-DNA glycosylase family 4
VGGVSAFGKRIRGEGPIPCKYFLVGEYPNKDDAKSGRPFSGKSYRANELDRFLDGISLPARHEMYVTTWVKDWCGPDGDYTADDYLRDEPELISELKAVRPTVIIALGRETTQFFLGDVDMEEVHGISWRLPVDSSRRGLFADPDAVVVFPVYNPAAGFRSPELSAAVTYDFNQLAGFLDGAYDARILYDDPIPSPVYRELLTIEELDEIMIDAVRIGCDTEGWVYDVWSVQITVRDGEGFVIRSKNKVVLDRFVEWVNLCGEQLVFTFHSSLHELAIFRAIGIDTRRLKFDDTMIMAYNLQLEPQGLKPLCARHCNMKMEHYDEVMGDADTRLALDWIGMGLGIEEIEYEATCQAEFVRLTTTPYTDAKGKVKPGRRLKVLPKLPRTALHKSLERCQRSKRPRKLWDDQVLDRHVEARPKYGAMWRATLDHVPLDRAIRYAGRDPDGTHRLYPRLVERLEAADLLPVYQADLATVPLIDRMQQIGLTPDLAHFRSLSADLGSELLEIRARLAERLVTISGAPVSLDAAFDFNPNSSDQVGALLFDRFGIPSLKRTPGGDPSTNDKVLEALEKDSKLDRPIRDLISIVREYREVYKLKHTFVDQIPDFVNRFPFDGNIHATFRLTRVVTGRLAASDPNLLAMPKHGKFAKRFRQGFVGGDGAYLASWDLSQIELRVLAHLSQDPVLLNAFRTGLDLHATLAQRIFGVSPKDQDESKHRLPAKAVNFGIPMGMTEVGLCLELRKNGVDVDEADAKRWLGDTMSLYKRVPEYQQGKIAEARRYGHVSDIRGRRRYIGGIHAFDDAVRSEAERFAFSTPIQAGAQEIMKEAEAYIYQNVLLPRWDRQDHTEPLIQIHDDLVMKTKSWGKVSIEPHTDPVKAAKGKKIAFVEDDTLDREMRYAMTKVPAHWLSVPIETSGDTGTNWGSMFEIRKAA